MIKSLMYLNFVSDWTDIEFCFEKDVIFIIKDKSNICIVVGI